jgi:Zn-dependent protease
LNPLDGVVWYLAFVLSTTAHEAAHALSAYLGGDPTAYRAGQVSLNPVPHIKREPFGMVVMPLLAISQGWCVGWASTPFDPEWERRHPRRAAWMAAAGPGANLLIALIALVLLRMGLLSGVFETPETVNYSQLVIANTQFMGNIGRFLSILLILNVFLCILNMVPVPPFDGGTAITLLLPDDLALRLRQLTRGGGFSIVVLLLVFLYFGKLFSPVFMLILRLVHPEYVFG